MERFTPRAKKVLDIARKEAEQRGNDVVLPEHIMLGIMTLMDGVAYHLLCDSGVSISELKSEVE